MDVPDHTSWRALSLQSLIDLFAGPPPPSYLAPPPFSSSVGERKIMNHFVVISMFFGLRAQKAFIVVPVHDAATMRFPSLPICGDESSTTSPILRKRFVD